MGRVAKLIMVTGENNNKFYDMTENPDGSITAVWGRVDVTSTTTHYPVGKKKWETLLNSKLKKGYRDVTALRSVEDSKVDFATITDSKIDKLVNELQSYAKTSVKKNYTISSEAVTPQMVVAAQTIMDDLAGMVTVGHPAKPINDKLLDLYSVIPRRMKKVQYHLLDCDKIDLHNIKAAEKLIATEQATLDVMGGQVNLAGAKRTKNGNTAQTVLDAMGLQLSMPEDKDVAFIKKLLGPNARQFRNAYKVVNVRTQKKFDKQVDAAKNKTIRSYWHGSRNENWWSILDSGLVLRPTNAVITGKMFGYGIYFADKAQKSIGYSSLRGSYWTSGSANKGFLALFQVHMGHWLQIKHHQSWCYQLTKANLRKRGAYDSLYAEGGADLRNNEYIVYDDAQCTVQYLVEIG